MHALRVNIAVMAIIASIASIAVIASIVSVALTRADEHVRREAETPVGLGTGRGLLILGNLI